MYVCCFWFFRGITFCTVFFLCLYFVYICSQNGKCRWQQCHGIMYFDAVNHIPLAYSCVFLFLLTAPINRAQIIIRTSSNSNNDEFDRPLQKQQQQQQQTFFFCMGYSLPHCVSMCVCECVWCFMSSQKTNERTLSFHDADDDDVGLL